MSGSDYINLSEGNKCVIIHDNIVGLWPKGAIAEVVYKSNIEDVIYFKCRGTCRKIDTLNVLRDMERIK